MLSFCFVSGGVNGLLQTYGVSLKDDDLDDVNSLLKNAGLYGSGAATATGIASFLFAAVAALLLV